VFCRADDGQWAQLANLDGQHVILTARDKDLVLLREKSGSRPATRDRADIRLVSGAHVVGDPIPNRLTTERVVAVAADPCTQRFLALTDDSRLLRVKEDLSVSSVPEPGGAASRAKFASFLVKPAPPGSCGLLYLIGEDTIWKRSAPEKGPNQPEWAEYLQARRQDAGRFPAHVVGILPEQNGGALIGLRGGDQIGSARPHLVQWQKGESPKLLNLPGGWVGGSDNALWRDEDGGLWVGTIHGLFLRKAGAEDFVLVPGTDKLWPFAMRRSPAGEIWLAGRTTAEPGKFEGRVTVLDRQRQPHDVLTHPGTTLLSLGLLRRQSEVWVGGIGALRSLDLETRKEKKDLLPLLEKALRPNLLDNRKRREVWVTGFAELDDGMLVVTSAGLVRFRDDQAELVPLPDWPSPWGAFEEEFDLPLATRMLKRTNGEVLISAPLTPRKSRLWRYTPATRTHEPLGDVPLLTVLVETDTQEVLAATGDLRILTLQDRKFEEAGDLAPTLKIARTTKDGPLAPFAGIAVCGPNNLLIKDRDHDLFLTAPLSAPQPLDGDLPPWIRFASLADGELLLLHRDGVVSRVLVENGSVRRHPLLVDPQEKVIDLAQALPGPGPGVSRTAWLVGETTVWTCSSPDNIPKRVCELPPELSALVKRAAPEKDAGLLTAADQGGLWLGIKGRGLWHISEHEKQFWDERDGLPSRNITAIGMATEQSPLVFTTAGHRRVAHQGSGWAFKAPEPKGVAGTTVQAAALFAGADPAGKRQQLLALGSERGVSLLRWADPDAPPGPPTRWYGLNEKDDGLVDDHVTALCWVDRPGDPQRKGQCELWVGTTQGVTVFTLRLGELEQSRFLERTTTLTEARGFPAGRVTGIRFDQDGANGWFVVNNRLCRWNRDRNQDPERVTVAGAEPFLFAAAAALRLGPAVGKTPPRSSSRTPTATGRCGTLPATSLPSSR
jgi:hypothetical protein